MFDEFKGWDWNGTETNNKMFMDCEPCVEEEIDSTRVENGARDDNIETHNTDKSQTSDEENEDLGPRPRRRLAYLNDYVRE